MIKICSKCKQEKILDDFSPNKNHKDGKCSWCKKCYKNYRIINKDYWKNYIKNNKEKLYDYYLKNKEKRRIYKKKWREENKEQIKDYRKKYINNNKEKIKKQKKKYRNKHKIRLNNYISKYYLKRKNNDISFKIKYVLYSRIYSALKGNSKSLSTMLLIGCEIDYLMFHLQSQFKPEMNWDNHGEWHIDHIRPCASFDLSKPEEQFKCFHYTNLQPLWAKDNLEKSNKIFMDE